MTEKRENTLVKGDIQKALIRMALPLMAFSLINVIYSFIDTYWVSKIGELQVGAISLVSTVNSCGTAFITGLSAGGMALMSRAIGANERQRANHIATILLTSSLILALLIGVFIVVFARDILAWLKTPQDIHEAAYLYLIGTATDFAGLFTITIFQAIRQSNGDSKSGVIINICAVILNAVLDPLMIITFNMGILGAALATSLSKALMIPLVLWALMKDTTVIHVNFRKYRFNLELFREIFRVSLPAAT
ncbi:MAG: polysaccharide biosynthesis C-terminal domain-containing protein, partial [Erysipelotrichaceae bacterium]|nr:polysaccharide biosynthesis C-terminal domain-containing protein [Erysipelotrichaceae bacterium]